MQCNKLYVVEIITKIMPAWTINNVFSESNLYKLYYYSFNVDIYE